MMTAPMTSSATDPNRADNVLDQLVEGRWFNPETGRIEPPIPIRSIAIRRSLDGAEADLVAGVGLAGRRLAVLSDGMTREAMGRRVETALKAIGSVDSVVLDHPHADMETVREVGDLTRHADAVIAVGSGTVNDLAKYATLQDGRPFAVFATAASMNGYTSTTAAITEDGLKKSLPAQGPLGMWMDLDVIAAAPPFLTRSGLGDSLCRSTAQVDWLLSNHLLGTPYYDSPFILQADDEGPLLALAGGLDKGDLDAIERLCRILTLCGLGACFTGTSHHGSMSEHLVSHWIDMFAGADHPGTLHGHQVGIAALSMSRLQDRILAMPEPPVLHATAIDADDLIARYGAEIGEGCLAQWRRKALDSAAADRLNARLADDWPGLVKKLRAHALPTARIHQALAACGGFTTAEGAGLPPPVYQQAIRHAREIRDRFSILDIAGDADLLDAFAAGEGHAEAQA